LKYFDFSRSTLFLIGALAAFLAMPSCSLVATRPVQEMSDANAALKAAVEVQADTLAPELYRQAREWFFKARQEYQLKNFYEAKDLAERSRRFAERAEFEAIRNGAARTTAPADPLADKMLEAAPPAPPAEQKNENSFQAPDRKEYFDETPHPLGSPTPVIGIAPPISK
jgi:hypothetical protein